MISLLEPSIIYKIVTCSTIHFGPFYVIRMTTLKIEWPCWIQAFKHPTDDILYLHQMPSILNHLFITASLEFGISSYNKTATVRLRRPKFQSFYWVQLIFKWFIWTYLSIILEHHCVFLWTISNVLIWAKNVGLKRQVYLTQCIYKK